MGPEEPDIESMPKIGNLYCLDLDGSLHTLVRNIGISNGLAWNEDEKTMYYVDSTPRQIYRYSYDAATRQICMIILIFCLSKKVQCYEILYCIHRNFPSISCSPILPQY